MKAVRLHTYRDTDTLVYEDAARQEPGRDQLLVQVLAAGVQPADLEIRRGDHADWGFTFPLILGYDVSGVVAAIGDGDAGGLEVGSEVWGQGDMRLGGTYAEYAVVPAATVGPKPRSLSHVEAAASVVAAATAYEVLFDLASLRAGQHLLVVGASGAVGVKGVKTRFYSGCGSVVLVQEATEAVAALDVAVPRGRRRSGLRRMELESAVGRSRL